MFQGGANQLVSRRPGAARARGIPRPAKVGHYVALP
jgi:hypothetical protein